MLFATGAGTFPASDVPFPSTARTAAPTAVEFATMGARGLTVVLSTTAGCDAGTTITVTIKGVLYPTGKIPGATAVKWTLLASAAIATNTTTVLQVAPELGDTPNLMKEHLLPDLLEISVAHGNSDSVTYSVTAILHP